MAVPGKLTNTEQINYLPVALLINYIVKRKIKCDILSVQYMIFKFKDKGQWLQSDVSQLKTDIVKD